MAGYYDPVTGMVRGGSSPYANGSNVPDYANSGAMKYDDFASRNYGSGGYVSPTAKPPGQSTLNTPGNSGVHVPYLQQPKPAAGGDASGGGNIGTYQTGIEHGLLSNDAIAKARAALQPTAPMPTVGSIPISGSQQAQLGQQYGDLMRQGTQSVDMGLTRDAAYQQAQMALTQQKALAGAANAGFSNLIGADATNTQADQARQGMLLNMLKGLI